MNMNKICGWYEQIVNFAPFNLWSYLQYMKIFFKYLYFFSLKQDLWSRANKIFEILNFQKSSKKNDDFQPISRKKTEI